MILFIKHLLFSLLYYKNIVVYYMHIKYFLMRLLMLTVSLLVYSKLLLWSFGGVKSYTQVFNCGKGLEPLTLCCSSLYMYISMDVCGVKGREREREWEREVERVYPCQGLAHMSMWFWLTTNLYHQSEPACLWTRRPNDTNSILKAGRLNTGKANVLFKRTMFFVFCFFSFQVFSWLKESHPH